MPPHSSAMLSVRVLERERDGIADAEPHAKVCRSEGAYIRLYTNNFVL